LHRLIAERDCAAAHQFTRDRRLGREMEIGEQDEIASQVAKLGALRLLDLQHHPRATPYGRGRSDCLSASRAVLVVSETAARPGAVLHQHAMAVIDEDRGARRRQRDAPLIRLYFGRHSDDHRSSVLSVARMGAQKLWRTGYRNLTSAFAPRLMAVSGRKDPCRRKSR